MRRLFLAVPILALAAPAASLAAEGSGGSLPAGDGRSGNPCLGPFALALECPNLTMAEPEDLYAEIGSRRTLLRAANSIQNVGTGPMELRGRRKKPRRSYRMSVLQAIRKIGGGNYYRRTGGELFFKAIPGQYRYWKFVDAASLEIWSLDAEGKPEKRVRRSPKQVYCFRDLIRMDDPPADSPGERVYPACNQDPDRKRVTLGTSVGWIDRYPARYFQQYVSVRGLTGRYAYVMRADPKDRLAESNESDNSAYVIVELPPKREGYLPGY
jgi:hypothetical protein